MSEVVKPGVLQTPKPKREYKLADFIVLGLLLVIIIALAFTLLSKLKLKQEVSHARRVTDSVVADIGKQDGTAARSLGTAKFKATYSATQLTAQFKTIASLISASRSVDRQTVFTDNSGKTVYIIYKYADKTPYYIRVAAFDNHGSFQLNNIAGSTNEASLIVK